MEGTALVEDSNSLMNSLIGEKESFSIQMAERHTSNIAKLVTTGLDENNSLRAEREKYKRIAIALLSKCREQGLLHSLHTGWFFFRHKLLFSEKKGKRVFDRYVLFSPSL